MNPIELTEQLKQIYGSGLEASILYGSAANGEFHKGHSDHNMVVVLKELAPVELAKCANLMKKWVRSGNPLPLFFTAGDIASSGDVFPIEFMDIIRRRKLIYGADPFEGMTIDMKNLRHQCEHELRSKKIALEQRFVLLSREPEQLIKLMIESSSSFFAIFRGIIRLAGGEPDNGKKALAEQMARLTANDMGIFIEIVDVREGSAVWKKEDAVEKFEQYLTSIKAVIRYADKI